MKNLTMFSDKTKNRKRYFVQAVQIFSGKKYTPIMNTGHEALLLVDNKGNGEIFGLNWDYDKYDNLPVLNKFTFLRTLAGRKSYIEHFKVNSENVQKILAADFSKSTGDRIIDSFLDTDNKPVVHDLPYREIGDAIYNRYMYLKKNPPVFHAIFNNCVTHIHKILDENKIETPYHLFPDIVRRKTMDKYTRKMKKLNKNLIIDKQSLVDNAIYVNRIPPQKDGIQKKIS